MANDDEPFFSPVFTLGGEGDIVSPTKNDNVAVWTEYLNKVTSLWFPEKKSLMFSELAAHLAETDRASYIGPVLTPSVALLPKCFTRLWTHFDKTMEEIVQCQALREMFLVRFLKAFWQIKATRNEFVVDVHAQYLTCLDIKVQPTFDAPLYDGDDANASKDAALKRAPKDDVTFIDLCSDDDNGSVVPSVFVTPEKIQPALDRGFMFAKRKISPQGALSVAKKTKIDGGKCFNY